MLLNREIVEKVINSLFTCLQSSADLRELQEIAPKYMKSLKSR